LWERVVLYALGAQVFRCRDCKKRFWVGVEWGRVILGTLAGLVLAGVIVTMVVARQNQRQLAKAPPNVKVRKTRRRLPMPRGLPPLSSVPLPADTTEKSQTKTPASH
jgi:hypothetical protein